MYLDGDIYLETAVKSLTEGQFYKQLSQRLYGWISKNIYYFLLCWVFSAAHGLSLAAGRRGYSLAAVHGLLIAMAFLVWKHGRFSSCGMWALELELISCGAPA